VDIAVASDRDRLVLDAHHKIDFARPQVGDCWSGFALNDFDREIRGVPGKAFQGARQESERWGLHEGHAEGTSWRISRLGQLGPHRLIGVERLFGVGGQPASRRREFHVASNAAQQLRPRLSFQLRELHRDGGRTVGQRLSDGGDRPPTSQLMKKAQPPQFHYSDNATSFCRKQSLVATNSEDDPGGVLIVSLLLAPLLMFVAVWAEQKRGATTGGWVAALPVSLPISVVTVAVDSGPRMADRLVWSVAGHVAAQVLFAAAFAAVLHRTGCFRGFLAGAAAYGGLSVVLLGLPVPAAAALAVPALFFAPRFVPAHGSPGASSRHPAVTALTCLGASLVVAAGVIGSRAAGPAVGGALAAFPTMSTLLALIVARRAGDAAGADALAGLVRSLPCYLAFCLCAAIAMPAIGTLAIPLALVACLAIGRLTWRSLAAPASAPSAA
jgi:hypothetical protein